MIEITKQEDFNNYTNSKIPLIVKFYSPECVHCKTIEHTYIKLAQEYSPENIIFLTINGQVNNKADYVVTGYPTCMFIKDGKAVYKKVGAHPISCKETIKQEIKQHLGVSVKKNDVTLKPRRHSIITYK